MPTKYLNHYNMKQKIWLIIRIIVGLFMINGGVQHFLKPDFYVPFVPAFLPFTMSIIYLSGVIEILLGLALFLKKDYAKFGALGLLLMMIAFLPVHVVDVFSATPAMGTHTAALIRLPIQFAFIALIWKVYRTLSQQSK